MVWEKNDHRLCGNDSVELCACVCAAGVSLAELSD